jgi:hypothetical protein
VAVVRHDVSEDYFFAACHVLVTVNFAPSSVMLLTLVVEAIHSSETSVLTRATRSHITEDGIVQITAQLQLLI